MNWSLDEYIKWLISTYPGGGAWSIGLSPCGTEGRTYTHEPDTFINRKAINSAKTSHPFDGRTRFFFFPYYAAFHFSLVVLDAQLGRLYYLDPAAGARPAADSGPLLLVDAALRKLWTHKSLAAAPGTFPAASCLPAERRADNYPFLCCAPPVGYARQGRDYHCGGFVMAYAEFLLRCGALPVQSDLQGTGEGVNTWGAGFRRRVLAALVAQR